MGSTNQSCSTTGLGAVPGQANQLAVKILELGDVVGEVDELQGGEWLHGACEHNQTKVRGKELVHLLLLHAAIWVEEEDIGTLILEIASKVFLEHRVTVGHVLVLVFILR